MDSNTYYTCKCIYFDDCFLTCESCQTWVDNAWKSKPVIFAKRWTRNHRNVADVKKKIFFTKYIDSTR